MSLACFFGAYEGLITPTRNFFELNVDTIICHFSEGHSHFRDFQIGGDHYVPK